MDVALLATLRDGLLRRSEAAALTWSDIEFRDDGAALVTLHRSKTDQEAEGVTLYIGTEASQALLAIRPAAELLDRNVKIFEMTTRHIGNRIRAAAEAAGLGEGFTGHSGRVGMAQDLVKSGVELPALMTAGRWKSSRMPATVHRTPGRRPGRGGQVLPRKCELKRSFSRTTKDAKHEIHGTIWKPAS